MKPMRPYKGYEAKVELDLDAKIVHGYVLGTRDVITFQSEDLETVEQEFHASVDGYLSWCEERGEKPDKPYSGHIAFRTTPGIHRRIAYAVAQENDCSLSKWIERACEHELERTSEASVSARSAIPGHLLGVPSKMSGQDNLMNERLPSSGAGPVVPR
jgi:predicted HicB family RNase H-like nuclease